MTDSFTWKGETYNFNPVESGSIEEMLFWDMYVMAYPLAFTAMLASPFLGFWYSVYTLWNWAFFGLEAIYAEMPKNWYSFLITVIYYFRNDMSFP